MANLEETAQWVAGIYQLEITDEVMGGPEGIDNLQAKQLANRTAYLKGQLEQKTGAASEANAGIAAVASQAETDDGNDDGKFVTPKKLKAWVKQASETVLGLIKVATQAQTDAGTDDTVAVTPKKLRWGFSILLDANGYIVFPSWFGGLIIQWGEAGSDSTQSENVPFNITFPNALYVGYAVDSGTNNVYGKRVDLSFSTTSTLRIVKEVVGADLFVWLAIGH